MPVYKLDKAGLISNVYVADLFATPWFQSQVFNNLQVDSLKMMTRLLDLVSEQEEEYRYRLPPQGKFYKFTK